jgi:3-oxoacyl-[acyl-carrier-protein] synthase-3
MPLGARIIGWGTALAPTVLTNADLEKRLDTTDAWIIERTGIRERRVGGVTSDLAATAAAAALARAGIAHDTVDLLILATSTPDLAIPATAAAVHRDLGLGGGAFDLNGACAGFVYALIAGYGAIATGAQRVLVVGADCMSQLVDAEDRSTAVLFGDGAGAIVLQASPKEAGLLGLDYGIDGTGHDLLRSPLGGTMVMEGPEVFRRAVRATVHSASKALERAQLTPRDVALFIPHQANIRIIEAALPRLGIPLDRTAVVLDRTGNTSSASIPLALAEAADNGRLSTGDYVLLAGFGAGMTWASAVVQWDPGIPGTP